MSGETAPPEKTNRQQSAFGCANRHPFGETLSALLALGRTMSATIETPDAEQLCAYCDSRIFDHDPICVRDCTENCADPTYFCKHACLSAYIDDNDLTTGNVCEWSPT